MLRCGRHGSWLEKRIKFRLPDNYMPRFESTNRRTTPVGFREALFKGLAFRP